MPSFRRQEVQGGLLRKGFRQRDTDHAKFIYYSTNGKKTSVWTKISRGADYGKIEGTYLKQIVNQCKLSVSDFQRLIECPLSLVEYEQHLITGGHIIIE